MFDAAATRAGFQTTDTHFNTGFLGEKKSLSLGIDIGSTSSDVVLLDENNIILFSDYRRTKGRPTETIRGQLAEIFELVTPDNIVTAAATGSCGRHVAELLDIPFANEVSAQAGAISAMYPELDRATLIEMGGQDSKLIFLERHDGRLKIKDFATNTACAAGTGSFLDQQAERLGIDIENEFGQMALQSKTVPRLAGRCSVFAKSDMIHLQQEATPTCDIIAGLCLALARGLKSNLGCGRDFPLPIIFTGGVAANKGVTRAFESVLDLEPGRLIVPGCHLFTGAIGAVIVTRKKEGTRPAAIALDRIDEYLSRKDFDLIDTPRRPKLPTPNHPEPESRVYDSLLRQADEPIEAYLGLDVGSISTNLVVMDAQKRVLAKEYLMTAGDPLRTVRHGLQKIAEKVRDKIRIVGAASTGSGRYLTGDFIGADIVINEITAQAAGAAIVNPLVDTIFEIGGQDSKYISLENGVVVDFEMNHACAAGTGSFLEEQAKRLGISINKQFAELAFKSDSPIKLGERCTVFIESDLIGYQQKGACREDLVAGLAYSIVANYLNRVVGRRKIGNNICFQGGTAFNRAVLAAFEKITGKAIAVPDHHEVTGALGAASIAAEHMTSTGRTETKFRGFDNLTQIEYKVKSFACRHCSNNCKIRKVTLVGSEPLFYGSRCDRYNLKKPDLAPAGFDAFRYREQKLLEYAGMDRTLLQPTEAKATIGMPRALAMWQMLPLFATFFRELGFNVLLSDTTDKETIRSGVESATAQTCFPVKVAYGHVGQLLEKKVDYIFIPAIASMKPQFENNNHSQLCPYVQSLAFQVRTAFACKLGKTKILSSPLHMGDGEKVMNKSFVAMGRKLGLGASAVKHALDVAMDAQQQFEQDMVHKGRDIIAAMKEDEKLFVLISRPYNGCDRDMNMELPDKIAAGGHKLIPIDMLDLQNAELSDKSMHGQMYWTYGQKILRAAEIIRANPSLFAIYLSNFSCGPDSFLQSFFRDIVKNKPSLLLEVDEHSADAGVITRLEAFMESLKHYKPVRKTIARPTNVQKGTLTERKLYIPYMGDTSYGMAACFRAYGQDAQVMPVANESTLLQGRKYTTGKECLPCAITIGEMIKVTRQSGFDPARSAFFMPTTAGPCRFGMYNVLQKLVLKQIRLDNVPIISPNQDASFYEEFTRSAGNVSKTDFMKHMWTAIAGLDLLVKVLLNVRPFAIDQGLVRTVYKKAMNGWIHLVENRPPMSRMTGFMDSVAAEFADIPLCQADKPKVTVLGEIYVRNHPFANNDIIARLEKLGAACQLASVAEWVYYTNFTRMALARRRRNLPMMIESSAQSYLQHRVEKALAAPLEKRFGRLAEGPIEDILKLAEPYIDRTFQGEAILSVGKMIESHRHGTDAVVNVMPFTCMPSTIVATQTTRISADCGQMPILNISFDGQKDASLTTRLEAFMDQIRQRRTVSSVQPKQTVSGA